jgi:signal transduction histidine kinase
MMKVRTEPAAEKRIRHHVASILHDELGQHIVGTLMIANVLSETLKGKSLPEARMADQLVELLKEANSDVHRAIRKLDTGGFR